MILHIWDEPKEFSEIKTILIKLDNAIAEFKSTINSAKRNSKLDDS